MKGEPEKVLFYKALKNSDSYPDNWGRIFMRTDFPMRLRMGETQMSGILI